ncbi:MAG TPA: rod shape-determining protein MreC [Acetobacteraceae bacterium]|nr:rod shape-determining protein MreC [Acetobacteraceae bacterium]
MIRISVQLRQALARLTLPVLFVLSFGVMLIGKADTLLVDRARISLGDALGPVFDFLAVPLAAARAELADLADLWSLRDENRALREEVARLRQWQSVALRLEEENRRLKAQLNWIPDPPAHFVTGRVVADGGGLYARAALLSVGPNHQVRKGEIAVDEAGLVGRVTEVGARTARVLLITDLSSRIPVLLEQSHSRAILAGANTDRPRLLYWTDAHPVEGERVVTSGEAGAFPADLPVGTVHWSAAHVPEVVPAAKLGELGILRLFDFQLGTEAAEPSG